MPIYEYRCASCGHEFEVLQRMNAAAPACPACDAPETSRRVSLNSFRLTGSGWYATDYKPAAASAPSKGAESGGGSDTGGEGSSEASAGSDTSGDASK